MKSIINTAAYAAARPSPCHAIKAVLVTLILLIPCSLSAEKRPEEQLLSIARNAINQSLSAQKKAPRRDNPSLLYDKTNVAIYGYAGGGYAVVATDDLLPEVLGYSNTAFEASIDNANFLWWLNAVQQAADYYVRNGISPAAILPDTSKYPARVLPMLSSEWGQEEPYNNLCPMVFDDQGLPVNCLVGCVATALSQIMYYHKSAGNQRGTATVGVPHDNPKKYYTVDYGELSYDWDNIRDTYSIGNYTSAEAYAVAELCYSVGVACDMIYDYTGSGAMSEMAFVGLQRNFGMSETCHFYGRGDYSENAKGWMNLIFKELADGRPLFYTGSDFPAGGHAFVFDGYDEGGRVHVNWGWYGRYDGFYSVDLLNPNIYNFATSQDMITGIQPRKAPMLDSQTLDVAVAGTLSEQLTDAATLGHLTLTGSLDADDFEAIRSCSALQTLDLSAATLATSDSLPAKALYGCSSLHTLRLPVSMRAMGDGALAGCSNLDVVELPEGADKAYTVVGDAVYNTEKTELLAVLPTCLETVDVAEGVTTIHPFAFEGCKRVRIITLPSSLTMIGEKALSNMPIVRELHVKGGIPAQVGVKAFENIDPGFLHLYIPAGLYDEYSHAAGWSHLFKSKYVTEVGTTIKARNMSRKVGEENPVFTYEIYGDNLFSADPQLSCEATAASPAGVYPIHVTLTTSRDDVTLIDGSLFVEATEGENRWDADINGVATYTTDAPDVLSRTTLSGQQAAPSAPGIHVIRYADGTIRKQVSRR